MRSNIGYCNSCKAKIFWARTAADKPIPLDLASVPKEDHGKLALRFSKAAGHIAHFTTCPNADQHRKRGA